MTKNDSRHIKFNVKVVYDSSPQPFWLHRLAIAGGIVSHGQPNPVNKQMKLHVLARCLSGSVLNSP